MLRTLPPHGAVAVACCGPYHRMGQWPLHAADPTIAWGSGRCMLRTLPPHGAVAWPLHAADPTTAWGSGRCTLRTLPCTLREGFARSCDSTGCRAYMCVYVGCRALPCWPCWRRLHLEKTHVCAGMSLSPSIALLHPCVGRAALAGASSWRDLSLRHHAPLPFRSIVSSILGGPIRATARPAFPRAMCARAVFKATPWFTPIRVAQAPRAAKGRLHPRNATTHATQRHIQHNNTSCWPLLHPHGSNVGHACAHACMQYVHEGSLAFTRMWHRGGVVRAQNMCRGRRSRPITPVSPRPA
eukprot:364683-Chlamydomonas_euryale.AAC.8